MPYDYPIKYGKYLLTRRIAVGGMAEVFKAKLVGIKGFEKTLAVKRILPEFNEDDEFVQMFVDEARISSNLHHSQIVQVFDFGRADGSYFIAMEFVDGPNLKNLVQRIFRQKGFLPRNVALYILLQVARALEYAHNVQIEGEAVLNLVHRDVSPQNVLISRNGEVKITDFGIAKAAIRLTQTQPGKIQGKFSYMSPEQAMGKSLDRRSDIFSLGIIAYELLTGNKLYGLEDTQKRYKQVREAKIPHLGNLVPDVPSQLESLVMSMLEKNPDDRPPSGAAVAAELVDILSNISVERVTHELGQLVEEYFPRERSDSDAGRRMSAIRFEGDPSLKSAEAEPEGTSGVRPRTKSIDHNEPTVPATISVRQFGWLLRWALMAIGFFALLFFSFQLLNREPKSQETERPTASPSVTPQPKIPTSTPPPPPDFQKNEAEARERELEEQLAELATELRQAEGKVEETTVELAKTQKELREVVPPPLPPPCPNGMVLIKEGAFLYGSDENDPNRNELVENQATMLPLHAFCIDRYEYPNEKAKEPRTMVTRIEAQELCANSGKRLCGQEEWERACKGETPQGKNQRYPYGNRWIAGRCNTEGADDQSPGPQPAGSLAKCRSPEGVYDMSGNVDEWTNSPGRFHDESRVTRGGSYLRPAWATRCSSVRELVETTQEPDVGFRCCKDAS